jgi:hypothetical protein
MVVKGARVSSPPRQTPTRPVGSGRALLLPERRRWPALAFAAVCCALLPVAARAYTAADDRIFPATVLLPQPAPTDSIYVTPSTQPVPGGNATNLTVTLDKTLIERLGVGVEEGYNWIGRQDASTLVGWQNLLAYVKYEAILDPPHEFLLSVGAAREFGGTGTRRVGPAASPLFSPVAGLNGATLLPTVFFAKGLGDLPIGYLRPLALQGFTTYQLSDAPSRPDNFVAGLAIEYSIPYLQSKVTAFDLPDLLRGLTPLVETLVATPTRNRDGATTVAIVAPGVAYSGLGWEFAIEAQVPATHAAGTGVGVRAQFTLSLDYFFPDSIGRRILSGR